MSSIDNMQSYWTVVFTQKLTLTADNIKQTIDLSVHAEVDVVSRQHQGKRDGEHSVYDSLGMEIVEKLFGRRSLSIEAKKFTEPEGLRSGEGKNDHWSKDRWRSGWERRFRGLEGGESERRSDCWRAGQ